MEPLKVMQWWIIFRILWSVEIRISQRVRMKILMVWLLKIFIWIWNGKDILWITRNESFFHWTENKDPIIKALLRSITGLVQCHHIVKRSFEVIVRRPRKDRVIPRSIKGHLRSSWINLKLTCLYFALWKVIWDHLESTLKWPHYTVLYERSFEVIVSRSGNDLEMTWMKGHLRSSNHLKEPNSWGYGTNWFQKFW